MLWITRLPAENPGMQESNCKFGVSAMIQWVYVIISPLPLLLFAALLAYTSGLEGWGAWASGPMFLPVFGLSAVQGLVGVTIAVLAESLRWRTVVTAASVLAGSPAVWLPVQALVQAY